MTDEQNGPSESDLRIAWQTEAREQTLETLPAFLAKLAAYDHDYGSIVVAIGAAAVGAAWAIERSPHGGITGFQASCVTWELILGWQDDLASKPLRLVNFADMLFPQYRRKFDRTISRSTFEWLQTEARKCLADNSGAHPAVVAHWESIANGRPPFGYQIEEGDE